MNYSPLLNLHCLIIEIHCNILIASRKAFFPPIRAVLLWLASALVVVVDVVLKRWWYTMRLPQFAQITRHTILTPRTGGNLQNMLKKEANFYSFVRPFFLRFLPFPLHTLLGKWKASLNSTTIILL